MKITKYLHDKLKKYDDEFIHKGEKYKFQECGGTGDDSYLYMKSLDSDKVIKMCYIMKNVRYTCYIGIEKITSITWWENYDDGIIIDEKEY